jgi:hypothetical protein
VGKNRSSDKKYRATQQLIASNFSVGTKDAHLGQPSKAELRAMIPPYDETKVRRFTSGVASKRASKQPGT